MKQLPIPDGFRFARRLLVCLLAMVIAFGNFPVNATQGEASFDYKVMPGDTLSAIALKFGISVDTLLQDNKIDDKNLIQGGQVLHIRGNQPASTELGAVVEDEPVLPSRSASQETVPVNGETISIEVVDTDIRDVLSSLALSLNKSIVYSGDAVRVTFRVADVSPQRALELMLQSIGMQYLDKNGIMVVGTSDILQANFFSMMAITRISLRHMAADVVSEQIAALGIPVQQVVLGTTPRYMWVQGTPAALAKAVELAQLIDRPEYLPSAAEQGKLEMFALKFIEAKVAETLLMQYEPEVRVFTVDANKEAVWVFGNSDMVQRLKDFILQIDIADNYDLGPNSEIDLATLGFINMRYLKSKELIPIVSQMGIKVIITPLLDSAHGIWYKGESSEIRKLQELIDLLDTIMLQPDLQFITYKLQNISANTAKAKLDFLAVDGVTAFVFDETLGNFSKTLLVAGPADFSDWVIGILRKLDMPGERIKVAIDFSTTVAALNARRDLLVAMSGVPATQFFISANISRDQSSSSTAKHLLYVDADPDTVKKLKDLVANFESP